MKALGVALAACFTMVLWPSAAHAKPIDARTGATIVSTDVPGWQAFDGDQDANDGAFVAQAGLDHSAHFAGLGALDPMDDASVSLASVIPLLALSTASQTQTTVALHTADGDTDGDDAAPSMPAAGTDPAPITMPVQATDPVQATVPTLPHGSGLMASPNGGAAAVSATPEPASKLLLGTGLAGVFFRRRQLFG